jgi:hypothetical protein
MSDFTPEQQRALAIARARVKLQQQQRPATPQWELDAQARLDSPTLHAYKDMGERALHVLNTPERIAYEAGGRVTDLTGSPGAGYLTNVAIQAAPTVIGAAWGPGKEMVKSGAKSLMQKALKPSQADLLTGKADRAITTMLDEGVNVSRGGMEKLQRIGSALNDQADDLVRQSPAVINKQRVLSGAQPTVDKFVRGEWAAPEDAASATAVLDRFRNSGAFSVGERERAFQQALAAKVASKQSALQDAGRYATMAAQQENLAHGGGMNVIRTAANQPYSNIGAANAPGTARALSPSAYPVEGLPRIAGRYTENIQRVPEARGAASDAMAIYNQRRLEEEFLRRQLANLPESERVGAYPVQLAQLMKQDAYRALGDKGYGLGLKPAGGRDTVKAIAHQLRSQIEEVVPEVAPVNAHAGDIWNALNVATRRALVGGNNNPLGLSLVTGHPIAGAGFLLDRWDLGKSALANAMYRAQRVPGAVAGGAAGAYMGQPDQ